MIRKRTPDSVIARVRIRKDLYRWIERRARRDRKTFAAALEELLDAMRFTQPVNRRKR